MMLSGIVDMRDWLRAFYAVICALNLGEAVGEAASSSAVARVHVQFAMTVKVGRTALLRLWAGWFAGFAHTGIGHGCFLLDILR